MATAVIAIVIVSLAYVLFHRGRLRRIKGLPLISTSANPADSYLKRVASVIPGFCFELVQDRTNGRWSFRQISESVSKFLSHSAKSLQGDFNLFLSCFEKQDINWLLNQLALEAEQEKEYFQSRLKLPGHTDRWFELHLSIHQEYNRYVFSGLMIHITDRIMQEEQLKHRIHEFTHQHLLLKERNRTSLAREIHDELGQLLTSLKLKIQLIALRPPTEMMELRENLKQAEDIVTTTITATRRLIRNLRPPVLDYGLCAGVEWLVQEFRHRTGAHCHLSVSSDFPTISTSISVHLFRILQESLTNIAKHSHATLVEIALQHQDNRLFLDVQDNGVGFLADQTGQQYGLMGIQERVDLLNGEFTLKTQPGKGVLIHISVPIHDHEFTSSSIHN